MGLKTIMVIQRNDHYVISIDGLGTEMTSDEYHILQGCITQDEVNWFFGARFGWLLDAKGLQVLIQYRQGEGHA